MILTKTAVPMHLKDNGVVYGHDLQPIGWWPFSVITEANLRRLWGQRCRIWLGGDYEIVRVERAT